MSGNGEVIFALSGGIALFLYGMDTLSQALQAAAGRQLQRRLEALTGGPVRGALAGAAATAVVQSSSAVTVMIIGLVGAGLLTLRQALPVIFGCNVGTTVTAQLLAFRLENVRGLVLLAGVIVLFFCAGKTGKSLGLALVSFGLLFEGMQAMTGAVTPLVQSGYFADVLCRVRQSPVQGFLAGLCMTALLQSSSASVALLQGIAARPGPDGKSLLGLAGALPVLLGCNVGTTVTAVLASLRGSRDAKRAAAAHAVFNLSGAVVFCAGLPLFVRAAQAVSPDGPELWAIPRQIANAHTLFNLVCTAVWLPLTPVMERLVRCMVPGHRPKNRRNAENRKR